MQHVPSTDPPPASTGLFSLKKPYVDFLFSSHFKKNPGSYPCPDRDQPNHALPIPAGLMRALQYGLNRGMPGFFYHPGQGIERRENFCLPEDKVFDADRGDEDRDARQRDGHGVIPNHCPEVVASGPLDKPEEGVGDIGYDAGSGADEQDERDRMNLGHDR
jgi:hypothetical protein